MEWLLIIVLQSTKDAAKFYTDKVEELGSNLKDLESIVQGKSNNLRVVEDGKQSRNIESQPLTRPQFYDRRFSLGTLVHQLQNKITCLLVDICFIISLFSCFTHCENECLSLPCSYIPLLDCIHSQHIQHSFPTSSSTFSPHMCQLFVRFGYTQERLKFLSFAASLRKD